MSSEVQSNHCSVDGFNPWPNQMGGRLFAQIRYELDQIATTSTPEVDAYRIATTKPIFLNAGIEHNEHLRWRERELKLLCLEVLWNMTWDLNQHHPRFQPAPGPDEIDYDYDLREPPLKEPSITRECLEREIAEWYITTKAKNGFNYPKSTGTVAPVETLPQSVRYLRWRDEQSLARSNTSSIEESAKINICNQAKKKKNWREVREEDLQSQELDKNEVCEKTLDWLQKKGNNSDTLESIHAALGEAQTDASKAHREQRLSLPLRLRKEPNQLLMHRFAIISLGKRGRGNSSRYKVIREA